MGAKCEKMDPDHFGRVVAIFLQNLLGPTAHLKKTNESQAVGEDTNRRDAWARTVHNPCRIFESNLANPVPVVDGLAIRLRSRPQSSDFNSSQDLLGDLFRIVMVDVFET